MRKFPIYFVVDVSESMAGAPLANLETGIRNVVSDLMTDPYALETAWVGVIGFAGRPRTLAPLTELMDFMPPHLPIGGGTGLGAALVHLMDEIDRSVVPTTKERKGDWKPLVFLLTDGAATDNPSTAIARWKREYAHKVGMVAVSIGGGADENMLRELTDDVMMFDDTEVGSFAHFVTWITNSVKSSTHSVTSGGDITLAKPSINLNKDASEMPYAGVDERYAVFTGKCQATKAPYVLKYERELEGLGMSDSKLDGMFGTPIYRLTAAVPVQQDYFELSDNSVKNEATVNSQDLRGHAPCPHCQARFSLAMCACGQVHCIPGDGPATCPWCGKDGFYQGDNGSTGGFDIGRGQG